MSNICVDRVTTTTYPDGEAVTSGYNEAMQPKTLSGGYGYVTDATYNGLGQLTKMSFGNTLNTLYRYWALDYTQSGQATNAFYGRLRGICVTTSSSCADTDNTSGVRMNISYAYDAIGNITTTGDRVRAERMNYAYDSFDRLTEWKQEIPYTSGTYVT